MSSSLISYEQMAARCFWNFLIPIPLKSPHWVRAVEVRPGNARVFHQANVVIDCSGSSRRQEKIAGFGFPGMDLAVEENTFDPRSTLPIMEAGKLADG